MLNKKAIAIISLSIASIFALSGCSVDNSSTPSDNSSSPSSETVKATEGQETVTSLAKIYSSSLEKAKTDGLIEQTTFPSNELVYVYDNKLNTSGVLSYNASEGVKASYLVPTESMPFMGTLLTFANVSSLEDIQMTASSNDKGIYTFIPTSNIGVSKVIITTNQGIITGYEIVASDSSTIMKSTIKYGNITEEIKAAFKKAPEVATNQPSDGAIPAEELSE